MTYVLLLFFFGHYSLLYWYFQLIFSQFVLLRSVKMQVGFLVSFQLNQHQVYFPLFDVVPSKTNTESKILLSSLEI